LFFHLTGETNGLPLGAEAMTNPEAKSGLYDRVCEIGNLHSAWVRVEESDGCAGIDGVTLERFAEDLDSELERLSRELAEGSYRLLPAAQFFVPKRGGGRRRLCVLAVRDRVAQHAVINIIRPIIEAEFEDVSYA
jgi:retron-type reverse transcriptase